MPDNRSQGQHTSAEWAEWRQLIFAEIARHDNDIRDIKETMTDIKVEQKSMVTKIALVVFVGSVTVAGFVAAMFEWMFNKL